MSCYCFHCRSPVVAILNREIEKKGYKITFQIFVCKECFEIWKEEKDKEGFK